MLRISQGSAYATGCKYRAGNTPGTATPDETTTHTDTPTSQPASAAGWCAVCAQEGAYTLAASANGTVCVFHGRLRAAVPAGSSGQAQAPGAADASLQAASEAVPSRPGPSGPGRRPRRARHDARAQQRARQRAESRAARREAGRRRAAARMRARPWEPHPGWRHMLPAGTRVVTAQSEALARVEAAISAETWRSDRAAAARIILTRLVWAMDWDTGLVCGTTRTALAAAAAVSTRTVSRVRDWAETAGLLTVVESGATAALLGTEKNRAATYALIAPATAEALETAEPTHTPDEQHIPRGRQRIVTPPTVPVGRETLARQTGGESSSGRGAAAPDRRWPGFQIPDSPAERSAAAGEVARRAGLDQGRVPAWRLRCLLTWWWREGGCVAGLLWALDHHPDGTARGDALAGARDPIRVLGHRLRPWRGQLDHLPEHLQGQAGDYRQAQTERLQRLITARAHEHAQQAHTAPTAVTPGPTHPDTGSRPAQGDSAADQTGPAGQHAAARTGPTAARAAAMRSIRTTLARRHHRRR